MEKRRKNAEILDRSIAFFYDMIYQINTAIQEQDLNEKSNPPAMLGRME